MARRTIGAAARQLEIFLDRVALLTSAPVGACSIRGTASCCGTEEEKELAARVGELAADISRLSSSVGSARGWAQIAEALAVWGVRLN